MLRKNARFLILLSLLLVIVTSNVAFAQTMAVTVSHTGNAGAGNVDFLVSTSTGSVNIGIDNTDPTLPIIGLTVDVPLPGGLLFSSVATSAGATFSCAGNGTGNASCTTGDTIPPGSHVQLNLFVTTPATPAGPFTFSASVNSGASVNDSQPFRIVNPSIELAIVDLTRQGNAFDNHIATGTNNAEIIVSITHQGTIPSTGLVTLLVNLGGGLTFGVQTSGALFNNCSGTNVVTCTTVAPIQPGTGDTVRFRVNAPSAPLFDQTNTAVLSGGGDTTPSIDSDTFSIVQGTSGATATVTPFPTFPIPAATVPPTLAPPTVIPTATLIPPPATRTPPPRPANAGQAVGPIPRPGVTVVVDRDGVNVRLLPAIGAEVIATVNAGFSTDILARSPDNQWVQILIAGQLGWIGTPVLAVVAGDLNSAPVADPRTIPYGGFENPRAGITSVTSQWTGKLEMSGLRVRGGPGRAYPVLANAPRYTIFYLLGRTADNLWLQVNFEGTLGWVATQFVNLQQGLGTLDALPIDGIVADGLPVSEPTTDSFTDTLRLMLSRVDLAQPSLDAIRSIWTSIALGERVQCGNYPARPTNMNIPNPVLAPFYATLFPLNTDFNAAMTSLREAIDLFIQICGSEQPPEGFVGQPVVQAALDQINAADALFVSLRERLRALLPPDRPLTDDECLFTYQTRSQVVPRLPLNQVILVDMTARNFVLGFCFDGGAGQTLRIEAMKVTGNAEPRLTVSSFDNPTNFIAAAELSSGSTGLGAAGTTNAVLQPILITQTGRYILIMADLNGALNAPLQGQIALLLTDITGRSTFGLPSLSIDPATGNVIVVQGGTSIIPATPGSGESGFILTPGFAPTPTATIESFG